MIQIFLWLKYYHGCWCISGWIKIKGKCYIKIPLKDSRPPRCMISKWQGGASLVHLLWHFSLSAYKRTRNLISVCLVVAVIIVITIFKQRWNLCKVGALTCRKTDKRCKLLIYSSEIKTKGFKNVLPRKTIKYEKKTCTENKQNNNRYQ